MIPIEGNLPDITKCPSQLYRIGEYIAFFAESPPSIAESMGLKNSPIEFIYALVLTKDNNSNGMEFIVTSERTGGIMKAMIENAFELGTEEVEDPFLCYFDNTGQHANLGSSKDWNEKSKFLNKAFLLAFEHLSIPIQPVVKIERSETSVVSTQRQSVTPFIIGVGLIIAVLMILFPPVKTFGGGIQWKAINELVDYGHGAGDHIHLGYLVAQELILLGSMVVAILFLKKELNSTISNNKVKSNDIKFTPQGIKGWSWAAFLWGFIWAFNYRLWWGILYFVPIINIAVFFAFPLKAREWAWQKNGDKWKGVDEFNEGQRRWVFHGIVIYLVLILGFITIYISDSSRRNSYSESAHENSSIAHNSSLNDAIKPHQRWIVVSRLPDSVLCDAGGYSTTVPSTSGSTCQWTYEAGTSHARNYETTFSDSSKEHSVCIDYGFNLEVSCTDSNGTIYSGLFSSNKYE